MSCDLGERRKLGLVNMPLFTIPSQPDCVELGGYAATEAPLLFVWLSDYR